MNLLLTGCAGFLGYHFCEELLKNNKKIKIFGVDNINDYYSTKLKKERLKKLNKYKNFQFYKIDIYNFDKLKKIFKQKKYSMVVHFAAQAGVRYSIENPISYLKSNIVGFTNIAECCRLYNVKKIFYASSSSIYGERKKFPAKEDDCVNPNNFYSMSKKNNEDVASIYSHYYNIQFVGLRFFTIYGEWGRPDMLLIKYINAALNKKFFS